VIAAAGNGGGHATSSPNHNRRFWPAADPDVIAVGAFNSTSGDVAPFTNQGDVYAPGVGLLSTYVTGWRKEPNGPFYQGWAKWSGTSFATPVVAAEIAAYVAAKVPGTSSTRQAAARAWLAGLNDSNWPGKPGSTQLGKIFRPAQALTTWPQPVP
jgi:subtilisin family serine protease